MHTAYPNSSRALVLRRGPCGYGIGIVHMSAGGTWSWTARRVSGRIKAPVTLMQPRFHRVLNKKAQLPSLTNPRDANACQNCYNSTCLQRCRWQLLVYLHSFSCRCVRNLLNPEKFSEISHLLHRVQGHPRSSILVSIKSKAHMQILIINSNFGRISYSFRDIDTFSYKIACFPHPTIVWHRLAGERLAQHDARCTTSLKITFSGLQFCRRHTALCLFI